MGWWYSGKHDSEGIQFSGWQWQIFWNPVSDGRIADQGRNVSGRDVVHVCRDNFRAMFTSSLRDPMSYLISFNTPFFGMEVSHIGVLVYN